MIVVGGGRGIGRAIAELATNRGTPVLVVDVVGDERVDLTNAVALGHAFARAPGDAARVVVLAYLGDTPRARPLIETTDDEWHTSGEEAIAAAITVVQATFAHLRGGGAFIVVVPTIAVTGAAGLVGWSTAAEAQRVLAKSAARRWGSRRITANTVMVPLDAFLHGEPSPPTPVLNAAALGDGDAVVDALAIIEFLGSDAGAAITGATFGADRGALMLP